MRRSLSDLTDASAVERALDEFDQLGRDAFLAKYGFRPARRYFLSRGEQLYDSKAVAGAALGFQYPDDGPLAPGDFSGGDATVARVLRELGYSVVADGSARPFDRGYDRLQSLFLLAWPDFTTFNTHQGYIREERLYKDELRELFRREITPLLVTTDSDDNLGRRCLELLRTPLEGSSGRPQNLVGWRYMADLSSAIESRPDGHARFGAAIRRLLGTGSDLGDRIDAFVKTLGEMAGSKHASLRRRGPQTAIATFYLGLSDPSELMFIKSTQLDDVLDACDPDYERSGRAFRGTDYLHFLGLARQILDRLQMDGYQPADLVDVQGFLWVSLTQAEGVQDDGQLVVRLTAGAVKNGYITLSAEAIGFFGEKFCGGPSADEIGQPLRLELPDRTVIETDIRRQKPGSAGRLRARFNALFSDLGLRAGDLARIRKLGADHYQLSLGTGVMDMAKADQNAKDDVTHSGPVRARSKNVVLYGPPGTGKTYLTARLAVEICDGSAPKDRAAVRQRYEQLRSADRISFVTFHQSFAYEEFVEGLRPVTDDGASEIQYEVRDGIFKRVCSLAGRAVHAASGAALDNLRERRIYKMSLGNTHLSDDASLYEESIRTGQLGLNWGGRIDYTKCESAEDIRAAFAAHGLQDSQSDYAIVAIDYFKNLMRPGDLVLISDGNTKFRAIGEVTGEYQYVDRPRFPHIRPVRWLATFEPSLPIETIFEKRLSQMTIYRPDPSAIKWDALEELLSPKVHTRQGNYVLIVDEINRANISKVLGELITLLEPDKRIGAPEELRAELPYSRDLFGVPDNVYVIGTMNTADRSLALLDTALRRRFEFVEMRPDLDLLNGIDVEGVNIREMLATINDRIELLYDREHSIGHSFLLPLRDSPEMASLAGIFSTRILPLLQEYFFEDWERIRLVLGDNQKANPADHFIRVRGDQQLADRLFGGEDPGGFVPDGKRLYDRNDAALSRPTAYQGIYSKPAKAVAEDEEAVEDT